MLKIILVSDMLGIRFKDLAVVKKKKKHYKYLNPKPRPHAYRAYVLPID